MNTSILLRRVLPALILVAIVAGGFFWFTRAKPVLVVMKSVDRGNVESTVVNTRAGTVEACQRTKLSTIMGGRIEYLGVKEGDKVKKGQLLMKLWNDDQKAQQTLAEAQRTMATQRVKEVCTTAASSRREAERQTSLKNKGFVSEAREDTAKSEADARAAACETARADVAQAAARVAVTRVEQGRMVLYAPFDGIVAKIVGELGEYSTPSPPGVPTPPAIDLIDDACLYVKAPMDEVDAPRIKAGLPVRVTLDALPKQPLAGKVRRVAPYVLAVEKQARTVDVEVDFERPAEGQLLVGYSADVEIVLGGRQNVLRVPTAALIEGSKVMILNADTGKLEERKVKAGVANWEFTEIVEGLAEGERIVTSLEREGVKVGARATAAAADEKSK
ncbi:efflux RND transporter periplasmic adaptor subunit [Sulfuritalea hydrogenivorans]|jgi:HlyD family secretion protein|uniref:Secretion protein HlyD n=1 Tax=Sulfuritalea hydrogenivorans sk43H TaxID=1223802 RepID=W0SFC5_9PROT|nr:efflux RND transporter periplasmic adaptor subunit [Sulfuritalea hydrogenivorans]MDK9712669.1 efflux RND transporter periplasmic adaptor subunit [Sulfuritalea sp.]BAO29959.1 secretion protein HlyD [Sulfuritalea hydrogenivorans sk43H]